MLDIKRGKSPSRIFNNLEVGILLPVLLGNWQGTIFRKIEE